MVHILQITLVAKLIGSKLVFCNYYTLCSLYLKNAVWVISVHSIEQ